MPIGTKIVALDFEVAQNIITNNDLSKILDTSDEWISTRTGIKKRRILSGNETSTDLAISAVEKVIKRANYKGDEFDMIITASSAPEEIYPSISCRIQEKIGVSKAACFDIKAACAGFIYTLKTAQAFIESGMYKNILIVATDATTKFTDWNDRTTCVLFGDGAGAAIIKADENQNDIIGIDLLADGSCADYITLTTKGKNCPLTKNKEEEISPFIQMKGKDVYKFVMQVIPPSLEKLMNKTNTKIEDIDYFIPHQSNQRMIDALAQRLNIKNSKVISNIEHYGNMSAASIIVALREAIDEGKIKLPAKVMLSAFGAGMTAGNAILDLEKNI